jgi:hypothetical protein
MFSNVETIKAWKYARKVFSNFSKKDIDNYLKKYYPEEFSKIIEENL